MTGWKGNTVTGGYLVAQRRTFRALFGGKDQRRGPKIPRASGDLVGSIQSPKVTGSSTDWVGQQIWMFQLI